MDFWTRFLGGTNNQKQQTLATTPSQRLQYFRRAYNDILQTCSQPQTLVSDQRALGKLQDSITQLNVFLQEENRVPAPHLCFNFAAASQVYSVIARAASASRDEGIIRQAVILFGLLVEREEDEFIGSPVFAISLIRFVTRALDAGSKRIGIEVEAQILEILFGITAKIRAAPAILPVWFKTKSRLNKDNTSLTVNGDFVGTAQKNDFPLCYLLVDRIHHEGRTGDFARTALLYIFEAASSSVDLEDWIIESDIPTLMATGLGALYSQLSRELSILHPDNNLPLMLALSDYGEKRVSDPSDAESIFSPTHEVVMSTFLSDLAFWQDILEHCSSPNVKHTLLDHFQILFLQQLLYPSLIQSSDTDGGSSVAVLTYLTNTLESLDQPDLTRMVLQYLLAIPEQEEAKTPQSPRSPGVIRRKSSLMLSKQDLDEDGTLEPTLFSLADLLINGLRSENPQTIVAALKLASVMLLKHRDYAVQALTRTAARRSDRQRTVGALHTETAGLLSLAMRRCNTDLMDEAYASICKDISNMIEPQILSQAASGPEARRSVLSKDDPFLSAISGLLGRFLSNDVDVNLALTETLLSLATCMSVDIRGWLTTIPPRYIIDKNGIEEVSPELENLDEEEARLLHSVRAASQSLDSETTQAATLPALVVSMMSKVDGMCSSIDNLDYLITKRFEILSGSDKASLFGSEVPQSRCASPSKRVHQEDGISITRSRSGSPQKHGATKSSQSTPSGLSQNIYQPPPPDDTDENDSESQNRQYTSSGVASENEAMLLKRRLWFHPNTSGSHVACTIALEGPDPPEGEENGDIKNASLSHVLTNIVILQYFILELVAVMQTRTMLLDEVAYECKE